MNNVNNNLNSELIVKSNNSSKIIILILVILLIGALGFICYDKFFNTEKLPVPTSVPNNITTPNNENLQSEYAEWMTYLFNQNITKITYQKGYLANSDDMKQYPLVTMSIESLKEFFREFQLYNPKLYKEYWGGRGDSHDLLTIVYLKDGKEYSVELEGGHILSAPADSDFVNSLESMGYTERVLDDSKSLTLYLFYDSNCNIEKDDCFTFNYETYLK